MVLLLTTGLILMSGCSAYPRQSYKDNYPEPCSAQWFTAVEDQLQLTDRQTKMPLPGSVEWLNAADVKLSISEHSGYPVGHVEWCHVLHQAIIGL